MSARQPQPFYIRGLGSLIFFSRWLQAPLYLGLIVAQAVYVYQFFTELWHLIHIIVAPLPLKEILVDGVLTKTGGAPSEAQIMIIVLGMVDVVMIANLLVMVIVGGYETFVSRLNLAGHPDQPEWLSHVNAGVLKVKLATALIGISSIHLLTTFIKIGGGEGIEGKVPSDRDVMWQVIVHMTFVVSAILLAVTDRISIKAANEAKEH